ncbi:MAG: glycosyltransferase family 4 protein [Bacteroidales bacterium]|nr:glycosyltransferase family 4 protein [Bacteroidales bacterium]MBN2818348.1 glycosyltransferase family 4 protein [Bacteroidales bacterium]
MNTTDKTICMLSDTHELFDDRIYWKECLSLKKKGFNVIHLGVADKQNDFLSKEGIRLISVERKQIFKTNKADRVFRFIFLKNQTNKALFKKARQIKADFYTIHDLKPAKLISRLKKLAHNPKVFYAAHESYADQLRDYSSRKGFTRITTNWYANYIYTREKKACKFADKVIAFDDAVAEEFKSTINPGKVCVIYNYTNLETTNQKAEKVYDLVYLGGISDVRGIINIIEALHECKKILQNIKLLLLGRIYDPAFKVRLFETIEKLELTTNIEYKEWVPYNDVPEYLSKSKVGLVLLKPIAKFYKNIPIKQFEYMAFGLPVIGSDLPPISNFIEPVEAGIIVDPLNISAISNAMINLLTDENLYSKHSKNGLRAAKEKYCWKISESELFKLYK